MVAEKPLVVLTIAGFDPSSGAGVTADIKTIAAHGCYVTQSARQATMPHRFRGLPLSQKVDTLETEVRSDQDFVVLGNSQNGTIIPDSSDYASA